MFFSEAAWNEAHRPTEIATMATAQSEWFAFAPEADAASCPCHGSGWVLSDYDVWGRCYVHATAENAAHPEDYTPEDYDEEDVPVAAPAPEAVPFDDDDLPF